MDLSIISETEAPPVNEGLTFHYPYSFLLESGESLPEINLTYSTYGNLNKDKSNVVWVCHALTGNSNVLEWWDGIFGQGKVYDTNQFFIVCVNVLGSHYGSTNPLSINPNTKEPYFHTFPLLTMRDITKSFELVMQNLGIKKIHTCIGGSLGGQQALEWAVSKPEIIERMVLLATDARTSPWAVALNETQRMAIRTDKTWEESHPEAGIEGMKVARAIALLSYRSFITYEATQKDANDELRKLKSISYQQYQGNKFSTRFNAFSYFAMTHLLDSHNVGRNRGSIESALAKIKAKTLIIGISSDVLFPTIEQEFMAKYIPNVELHIIESLYGHDGFLTETDKIAPIIHNFYKQSH